MLIWYYNGKRRGNNPRLNPETGFRGKTYGDSFGNAILPIRCAGSNDTWKAEEGGEPAASAADGNTAADAFGKQIAARYSCRSKKQKTYNFQTVWQLMER